jgi:stringent starvation protein A
MASSNKILLWDHSTSSYAQKVRIALRLKDIPFETRRPEGLGSGRAVPDLEPSNPRLEVPALEHGDFKMFDSTVILGYLEDAFPEKPLLPAEAEGRAKARMIEEVCDTAYEACNWCFSEILWSGRGEGELAEKMKRALEDQTIQLQSWLSEKLGNADYFNGETFGYADVCVAPLLNRSVYYGFGPEHGSPLQLWHARIKEIPSVQTTFKEMEDGAAIMATTMKKAFTNGPNKREYRDHRLEMMMKVGGVEVVLDGLKRDNIRFGWPPVRSSS